MTKDNLYEIKEKYQEYKDVIQKVEAGDYTVAYQVKGIEVPYTIEQIETMRDIVKTLDDMGFNKIVKTIQ